MNDKTNKPLLPGLGAPIPSALPSHGNDWGLDKPLSPEWAAFQRLCGGHQGYFDTNVKQINDTLHVLSVAKKSGVEELRDEAKYAEEQLVNSLQSSYETLPPILQRIMNLSNENLINDVDVSGDPLLTFAMLKNRLAVLDEKIEQLDKERADTEALDKERAIIHELMGIPITIEVGLNHHEEDRAPARFLHDEVLLQDANMKRYWKRVLGNKIDQVVGIEHATSFFHATALKIKQAERFVLDRDALDAIVRASVVTTPRDVRRLEGMLTLARLPHRKMFVEYDLFTKHDVGYKVGTIANVPETGDKGRAGWLLERVKEDDPCLWTALYVTNYNDGNVSFGAVGFLVCTDERGLPVSPRLTMEPELDPKEEERRFEGQYVFNDMLILPHQLKDESYHESNYGVLPWGLFVQRDNDSQPIQMVVTERLGIAVRVMLPRQAHQVYPRWMNDEEKKNFIADRTGDALFESRGDVRFLVTMLSLLNSVPIRAVARPHSGSKARMVGTKMVRYMDHSTIRINLSSTESVQRLYKIVQQRAKQRRHEVRGFWRTYQRGDFPCSRWPVDKHVWVPMHDGGPPVKCAHCDSWRVWVDEHERGDASLGWVRHDYEVTARHA